MSNLNIDPEVIADAQRAYARYSDGVSDTADVLEACHASLGALLIALDQDAAPAPVPARLSYYTSQDLESPRWSVYSEWYTEESYAEGDPIDGSQKHLCSAVDEATADLIASSLYATTTDNGVPVN